MGHCTSIIISAQAESKRKGLTNCTFYSDDWDAFAKVLLAERHVIGKAHTSWVRRHPLVSSPQRWKKRNRSGEHFGTERRARTHRYWDGKCWGMSLYRAPLLMSQRIPSKHARLGAGSCPPLGDWGGLGRSGASFFHWWSEISSPVWYSRFCIK